MPHPSLKSLKIDWYQGQKLPSWAMNHNLYSFLPNLVEVQLSRCNCQQVPRFSQLPFLKCLTLCSLESVEFIEGDMPKASWSPEEETIFFPYLQKLELYFMDNLKAWWKGGEVINDDQKECQQHSRWSFSNLSTLYIESCPNLKFMPHCPNVEDLWLEQVNKMLSVPKIVGSIESYTSSSTSQEHGSLLKKLGIGNLDLIFLPNNSLHYLSTLAVVDPNLKMTSKFGDIFVNLSSRRTLGFFRCHSLTSISGSFEHLTALEILVFSDCTGLNLSTNEGMEEGMPWKALTNLQTLRLINLPKLMAHPDGLQCLTNLCWLDIKHNQELKEIPDWISCLSSLRYLDLRNCPKLKSLPEGICQLTNMREFKIVQCPGLTKRCRRPNGEDWPKIEHIQVLQVLEEPFDPDT